ncbi:17720_t:CDS:2 [Cetraspora pellucida]|uniref:17720_t:CDS:1 n=1 Tax=Cetraspora pellucida TaxID=1433469 RepID=A0A9N9HGK9_9GLOM|nr:17720_t:CDS:2 [Cetraspora pellucida]
MYPFKNLCESPKVLLYSYDRNKTVFDIISPPNPKDFSNPDGYSFTVVTAANFNHWCQLKTWISHLNTIKLLLPKYIKPRIIIYDLGLKREQKIYINALKSVKYFTKLRTFNFSKYPEFWDPKNKTSKGEYGWKAGILKEISMEFPGILTWADTGTILGQRILENLPKILKLYDGFLSPRSSGTMDQWIHPGVFKYFNDDASKYVNLSNCNAAALFFDTRKTQYLIDKLYECALEKKCIAPMGSSRINHRQDQAILSYLVVNDYRKCEIKVSDLDIFTHGIDKLCGNDKMIAKYVESNRHEK